MYIWKIKFSKVRIFAVIAVIAAVVMMNQSLVNAEEKDTSAVDNYDISVPKEQGEYVILSEEKPNRDAEAIVEADGESVFVSDKRKTASDDAIVEKNISFDASDSRKSKKQASHKGMQSESAGCSSDEGKWVTGDNADIIKERYNTDWNREMIRAKARRGKRTKARNRVKVAVLDSGVDFAFTDVNVVKAVNLVENEQDYENMMNDLTGHGTSVARIISDLNKDVDIYSVRVLDRNNKSTLSRVVAGIYWCIENNADIINMSFGTSSESEILHKAVEDAEKAGILIVSAAGNDNERAVEYPARFKEVVAVGAVDAEGELSENNADGKEVELLAPGEEVFAESMLGLYTKVEGTSVAAPHAAAAASLIWQKDKNKSNDFVRGLLEESSNKTVDSDNDAGIIDVEFAEKIYDRYEKTPDRKMPENTNSIGNYADCEVSASWGTAGGGHKALVDFGISKLASGTFTTEEVTALKNGAVYPDAAHLSHECYHGRRTRNWIASYKYLTAMAKRLRSSYTSLKQPTGKEVFDKGTFTSMITIMKSDIKFDKIYWNDNKEPNREHSESKWDKWYSSGTYKDWGEAKILKNCNYSGFKAAGNTAEIAKLKSLFVYGLALHDLTDTFAHAAYSTNKSPYVKIVHKHDVQTEEEKKKLSPYTTDADNPEDYPNRWRDSKYASAELIKHAEDGKEGVVLDFAPNDYRVNGTGKGRGYYLNKIIEKAYQIKESSTYKKAFSSIDCASFK